jgi:hypothetical protein
MNPRCDGGGTRFDSADRAVKSSHRRFCGVGDRLGSTDIVLSDSPDGNSAEIHVGALSYNFAYSGRAEKADALGEFAASA